MFKTENKVVWKTIDSFARNFTSSALMQHRACPICGCLDFRTILTLNDFQFFTDSAQIPKRVNLQEVQCRACFALYLNPCYSDLGFRILFAEAGQSYGSTHAGEQITWLESRGLLRHGTRLLDVGCYDGGFLAQLPSYVKKVGVDIDGPAIERGHLKHSAHGIDLVLGDFESFHYSEPVDTIVMFHVLEHLPRPIAVLQKLRSLARAGTRLVIEVPVLENGITNDINGFFSVQHMTHFSRHSLHNCLAQAGWKIIERFEASDYNGCRVLAEPAEAAASPLGDPQDTASLQKYLSGWHQALAAAEAVVLSVPADGHLAIWGGGLHTEFLYQVTSFFQSQPHRKCIILDSDPLKKGKTWRGLPIHAPALLKEIDMQELRILISSYGNQEAIAKAAESMGVPVSKIIKLYEHCQIY